MKANVLPCTAYVLAAEHQFPPQQLNNGQLVAVLKELTGPKAAKFAAKVAPYLGVERRHFCRDIHQSICPATPSNSTLSSRVIKQLLSKTQIELNQLDYLIGHTTTPDTQLPANIAWVADKLKFQGPFMELRQACTGFVSALQIALPRMALLKKPIAIVGSETGSVYFNYDANFADNSQLVNYMQMGDGAGGVLLSATEDDSNKAVGVISNCFTGQVGVGLQPGLALDAGSQSIFRQHGCFHHHTTDVMKHGAKLFQQSVRTLAELGHSIDSFDYIVPHLSLDQISAPDARALLAIRYP